MIILSIIPILLAAMVYLDYKSTQNKFKEANDWLKNELKSPLWYVNIILDNEEVLNCDPKEPEIVSVSYGIYVSSKDKANKKAENIIKKGIWWGDLLYPPHRIKEVNVKEKV